MGNASCFVVIFISPAQKTPTGPLKSFSCNSNFNLTGSFHIGRTISLSFVLPMTFTTIKWLQIPLCYPFVVIYCINSLFHSLTLAHSCFDMLFSVGSPPSGAAKLSILLSPHMLQLDSILGYNCLCAQLLLLSITLIADITIYHMIFPELILLQENFTIAS